MTRSTDRAGGLAWIAPLVIFLVSFAAFGFSAFVDPDPHHDGVQIAPAIAISEGLRIHADVYDHYGPVTAWIHGLAVTLFGPQLLTIRLVTALLLAISAVLLFVIARRVLRPPGIAWLVVIAWIAAWPGRSVDAITYLFLPWPSITFLVLQMLMALILLRLLSGSHLAHSLHLLLGLIVGVAAITRLNAGIPTAIVVTAIVILLVPRNSNKDAGHGGLLAYGAGLGLAVAGILGLLVIQGSLGAYLQDAILGPLSGDATDGVTSWFYYRNAVLLGSVPLLMAVGFVYALGQRFAASRRLPWITALVGVIGLVAWTSTSIADSPLRTLILSRLSWAPALDHQAFQIMFVAVILLPIAALVALLPIFEKSDISYGGDRSGLLYRIRKLSSVHRIKLALTLLALVSLVQLYPFIDPNHVWWAIPLPLIVFIALLTDRLNPRWAWVMAYVSLLPTILIAIPRAIDYVSEPRTQVQNGVLSGMWAPVERMDDIAATDRLLLGLEPGSNRFDCWNGLFAVWSGKYLADSSAFVNWAPGFTPAAEAPPSGVLVRCMDVDSANRQTEEGAEGFTVTDEEAPVSISYYNYTTLQVLERH